MGAPDRPRLGDLADILAPAQVMLVRRRGWLGALIRRFTASDYSHAVLIECTQGGIWCTVEAADADGVKALRLESYLEDPDVTGLLVRYYPGLSAGDRNEIMRCAWLRVGQAYDTWQLVGIGVRKAFGLSMGKNRLDSQDRLICSELVSVAYHDGAGLDLAPAGYATGNVAPGDLAVSPALRDVWSWHDDADPLVPERPPQQLIA